MDNLKTDLTFSALDQGWVTAQLGDVVQFSKGKGISKEDIEANGKTGCIRYGELYTTYGEVIKDVISKTNVDTAALVLSEVNDVIIPSSGESQIDIARASCVLISGVALGGDLNILKTKLDGVYLSYYLNGAKKREIASMAQGISVVHLYSSQLQNLIIHYPLSILHSTKIASCLSSLDELIAAETTYLTSLQNHKKGLMQKLFPRPEPEEGQEAIVPELRFKEFEGEWEAKKLGKVFSSYSGGTPSTTEKGYYGGNIPFIRSAEINKSSTELYLTEEGIKNSSAKMVEKGDLLIAMYGANSGEVAISKITGAINQAILCLKSEFSNEFTCQYLLFRKDWITTRYLQGGQGNLSGDIIKSIEFYFPSKEEQQKIASSLSSLDNLIAAQTQKIDQLKLHKKGLMQGLFPKVED